MPCLHRRHPYAGGQTGSRCQEELWHAKRSGVGGVRDIAADIACETQDTAPAVRLDLIQVGIELDRARARRQGDHHCLDIHERQAESSDAGFKVNAMRVGR